ncbi:hypothetical protein [Rhodobacter lacus]|uniref:Uncharacterized protein n=1 Tax=Rhodobacter lacus TaxID=1641972 RepID=A0ABW5A8D4_9RHOB
MTLRILQSHLSELGDAFLAGDFERYMACTVLPLEVRTRRATLWVEGELSLEEGFDCYFNEACAMGVERIERRAVSVTGVTNRCLFGRFASCWLRESAEVVLSYTAEITLETHRLGWKTSALGFRSEDTRWPLMPHKLMPGYA